MHKIKSYMTCPVITVHRDDSLLSAYRLMFENKIRHLPVVDDNGVLKGILSDHDIQRAMIVQRDIPGFEEVYLGSTKKVAEFMSFPIFTIYGDVDFSVAVAEMYRKKVSAVVIIDDAFRCIGLITSSDILRIFLSHLDREKELSEKPLSFYFPNTLF